MIWYIIFHIKKLGDIIMKNNTTRLKRQIIGREELINAETGEVQIFNMLGEEFESDTNFHKVWIKTLCKLLVDLGGSKNIILAYFLSKMDNKNSFIGTISKIAKETGVSEGTVKRTLQIMKANNHIKMLQGGAYHLNPDLIAKGKAPVRNINRAEYNKIEVA